MNAIDSQSRAEEFLRRNETHQIGEVPVIIDKQGAWVAVGTNCRAILGFPSELVRGFKFYPRFSEYPTEESAVWGLAVSNRTSLTRPVTGYSAGEFPNTAIKMRYIETFGDGLVGCLISFEDFCAAEMAKGISIGGIFSAEGAVIGLFGAWEIALGHPAEILKQCSLLDFFPMSRVEVVQQQIHEALSKRRIITFTEPLRAGSDRLVEIEWTITPEVTEEVFQLTGNVHPSASSSKLPEKEMTLAFAAHELNGPLTAIHIAVDLLEKDSASNHSAQRHARTIASAAERITTIIHDIETLNRIGSGKCDVPNARIDLAEWIKCRTKEVLAIFPQKRAVAFDGFDQKVFVDTAPSMLEHAVSNLLNNALKYSSPESTVNLQLRRDGGRAILSVSDSGIGIPVQEQAKVFSPFERCSNTVGIPGNGLGLSITKRVVDQIGGVLSFESSEGKGTIFTISLPCDTTAA